MNRILIVFLLFSCSKEPIIDTGCWSGINKQGRRQLIGCYTQAQIVAAGGDQSWSYILAQYTQLQYDANRTCDYCQSHYK